MLLGAETAMIPTNLLMHYYSTANLGPSEVNLCYNGIAIATRINSHTKYASSNGSENTHHKRTNPR